VDSCVEVRAIRGLNHPSNEDLSLGTPIKIETWGTQKPELELTEAWLVANGY